MKHNIAVIGSSGSVGVSLQGKLDQHPVFKESQVDPEVESWSQLSKTPKEYKAKIRSIIESVDLVILCVADDVAATIIEIVGDHSVKIIDCSTAHRIPPDWTYGLPELQGQRTRIKTADRVSNPGCHATASILTLAPLYNAEINDISAISMIGYSGGGKDMIRDYESGDGNTKAYSIGKMHKYKAEIEKYSNKKLSFQPIVLAGESQGIHLITTLPNISPSFVINCIG